MLCRARCRAPPRRLPQNTYRKRTPSEEAAAHVRTRAATLRQKYPAASGSGCFHVCASKTQEIVGISQSHDYSLWGKNYFRSGGWYLFFSKSLRLVAFYWIVARRDGFVKTLRCEDDRGELQGFLTFVSDKIRSSELNIKERRKCH